MDKMRLIEELKQRILSSTSIENEELAAEIARRWVKA